MPQQKRAACYDALQRQIDPHRYGLPPPRHDGLREDVRGRVQRRTHEDEAGALEDVRGLAELKRIKSRDYQATEDDTDLRSIRQATVSVSVC